MRARLLGQPSAWYAAAPCANCMAFTGKAGPAGMVVTGRCPVGVPCGLWCHWVVAQAREEAAMENNIL